ncbi:uncharacterized protein PHACADRAFT_255476 [Phanerochaete carnosa HHB-10118-sp]|uniref:Uncharacterized protein n=1 Tax=Phanerochaete carnosa (strain HHB-10118-sp) TaxID=650164 RepID=K5W7F2_PHACS|nr:uncharacterized protein PHACADRAFT_255476 [Phanerochaete carnosa HHB-10118-sp]EKM55100.1 hypothetical protein PHACADRAFT_255476 [Phanerochaete carnosa HHB-10118-sp]
MNSTVYAGQSRLEQTPAQQTTFFRIPFSPYDPPNDFIPLYACRRRSSEPSLSSWGAPPPSYDDLMKTVDYRHIDRTPRFRSTAALSDILEEEVMEVIICDIVPPSPTVISSSKSTSTSSSFRSNIRRSIVSEKLLSLVHLLRTKYKKRRPVLVTNDGSKDGLDLFDS